MNRTITINDFADFLRSSFGKDQLVVNIMSEKFATVDIDCLSNKEKVLSLFLTPGEVALGEVYKNGHPDDQFAPFDKVINDLQEAKKIIEKIKNTGTI